jgi:pSer/pThr/pTyr-binding forkhead associated (FHA) protein
MNPLDVFAALRLVLAVVLYGFFGLLLWLWWRGDRPVVGASAPLERAELVVVEAGQSGLPVNRAFSIGPVCTIGRASTADVVVADDGASLEHAVIHRREGRWWIEDLTSKNGTRVNHELLTRTSPLRAGDMIAIASVTLRFANAGDAARDPLV